MTPPGEELLFECLGVRVKSWAAFPWVRNGDRLEIRMAMMTQILSAMINEDRRATGYLNREFSVFTTHGMLVRSKVTGNMLDLTGGDRFGWNVALDEIVAATPVVPHVVDLTEPAARTYTRCRGLARGLS